VVPHHIISSAPHSPCEQLLTAVMGGAIVIIIPYCHGSPLCYWRKGVVTWPLAPNPPCKQMLTVADVRCWALTPPFSSGIVPPPCYLLSSSCLLLIGPPCWPIHISLPPYKQLLIAEGSGAMVPHGLYAWGLSSSILPCSHAFTIQ